MPAGEKYYSHDELPANLSFQELIRWKYINSHDVIMACQGEKNIPYSVFCPIFELHRAKRNKTVNEWKEVKNMGTMYGIQKSQISRVLGNVADCSTEIKLRYLFVSRCWSHGSTNRTIKQNVPSMLVEE